MREPLGRADTLYRQNLADAKRLWALSYSKALMQSLRELTTTFGFSVRRGELIPLDSHWYVTHARSPGASEAPGLLRHPGPAGTGVLRPRLGALGLQGHGL